MIIPKEARRYMALDPDGHTTWRGVKFYGRPVWKLWLQRAVWEEAHGDIPPKSTVGETCGMVGCLTVEHLKITSPKPRPPAKNCRNCGSVLSRDKNSKTYCPLCNRMRNRKRRLEGVM